MSRSLNKLMLIGNVGAEPEVRTTGSGKRVATFSVATNESWTDNGGQKQEKVEWHRCVAWERLAEIIEQYVHKGDRIYVEGKVAYRTVPDERDPEKKMYFTDVVVREMVLISGSGGGPSTNRYRDEDNIPGSDMYRGAPRRRDVPAPAATSPFDNDDDDLPF